MALLRTHHSAAFSLIELLIVATIVSLLASMLLPAVGLVRAQAKTIACASNLRQLGMGFFAYANDAHGTLPPAFSNPNTNHWKVTYGGDDNGIGALTPDYLDDERVTVCPNFNLRNGAGTYASIAAYAKRYAGFRYNGNPYTDAVGTSLVNFVNPSVRNYIGRGWPIGLGRYKGTGSSTEGTVLAYDSISESSDPKGVYHPHPGDTTTRAWGYLPLVKGGNVLFCDGRVIFLPGADWRAENGSMSSGSYYCPLTGY